MRVKISDLFTPGYVTIPYNNVSALAEALKDNTVVGFYCGANSR